MKQTKNVPQLRFSGFDDDWEEKKLGEVSSKVTKKNINHTITETFTNSAEFGIISQRDFFDHNISNDENIDGYFIVENDDFVYNPRISTIAPVGPINRNKLGRSGVMSPLYYVFRTHDIDKTFLEKYFKSKCWYDFMFLNGNSGARSDRFSITDSVFSQMPIRVPCNEIEQQKIGALLSHVDSLIQAKTKKLESLKAVKKSLLQKCFPKAGEKVPEMRFAGFSGDWGEKKLGEIVEKFDYGLNAAATDFDGKNKYLRITDIDDENRYFKYDDVSSPDCILSESENFLLRENDIVFARTGASVGKTYIYNKQDGIVYFAGFLIRAHIKQEYDSLFIFQNTLSEPYNKYIQITSQRSGQPGVNAEEYKEYSVMCPPTLAEQQKIGQFFSKYDSLISAQQKEIDKLKDIKKSLLQKMFV